MAFRGACSFTTCHSKNFFGRDVLVKKRCPAKNPAMPLPLSDERVAF